MSKKVSSYNPEINEKYALELAQKLSKMIQCDTTSHNGQEDISSYLEFHKVLEKLFPLVHKNLKKTIIDGSLLFKWNGKTNDKPILLMSHQDVVPAEGEWIHEPFSGEIIDGKIWGRGAADTKGSLMAFFQAVEELLSEGFNPECDVYLASSCTEEWAGPGAPKTVEELKKRGVELFLLCDEGGAIIEEPVGGIKGHYAMVGISEKGRANIKFTAKSNGGHASAPPKNSPIARLSAFVTDIEKKSPFKKKFSPGVSAMFKALSKYADFPLNFILGNLWLFGPILKVVMPSISPQGAAMLQTTMAFTMQSGSDAFNVLPQEASVNANLRYVPHQGEKETLELLRDKAKKYDLEMEIILSDEYSDSVDINGEAYKIVEETIKKTFPGLAVSPYVMTAGTDAYFYEEICKNCIRFAPILLNPEQMKGIHGLNENIDVNCLPGAVSFYKNLIKAQKR
ncbi:MAG: M20/M25/M40 family metallo-hydrolase [Ruminococcaceae bacterium]|nr:M20/M25/M40 family metallo-hydrolase [Oscillospiraceae bacterium]